jgi:HlyD family secretion protein
MKKLLVVFILFIGLAAVASAGGWYWMHSSKPPAFRTTAVQRGDLQFTISATGTVEPEEVVDIGAQVAGQIKSLGSDPRDPTKIVDYTTPVEKGTILARIDDTLYKSDVDQAEAALKVAQASLDRAKADLGQMKAKLFQAENDWNRAQTIRKNGGGINDSEFDTFHANFLTAKSALDVGEATITQAESTVAQAKTALVKAQQNLGYCTIQSPVKGVIVDRRVNVGQTVVSSLSAPSLFLIAKDLKRMQVWVSVNEADIGQIHPGQAATFTVDAYPGETFRGEVGKIRLNATMTNNVVTYTVEVNTDNSSGKLLPYLTANLSFEVGKRTNVLQVPNAALRWWPASVQPITPSAKDEVSKAAARPREKATGETAPKDKTERGTIWVQDGKYVKPIRVKVGWSDGTMTEVSGPGVEEGMEVIIGEARQNNGGDATSNPFTPKMFGGGGNKQQ